MFFGISTELFLVFFLNYVQAINFILNTRDLIFIHFGIAGLNFSLVMILWDEIR